MVPSNDCYKLTESSEGCRLKAYQDTGGVWTIGYGHTGGVRQGQIITLDDAITLLKHDMGNAASFVDTHAADCTQGQFDALVDFTFNVGAGQFLSSHLLRYHNDKEYDKAADEFPKWKYDNGKVEQGLVTRRALERSLYTHQGLPASHQQTVEQEHSGPSTVCLGPEDLGPNADQFSEALLSPEPLTAPASDSILAELVTQAWGFGRTTISQGPEDIEGLI